MVGAGGVGPAGRVPVTPPESLYVSIFFAEQVESLLKNLADAQEFLQHVCRCIVSKGLVDSSGDPGV